MRLTRFLPYGIVAACALLWAIFFAVASPIFGGVDTFIFRDPGCNLAGHLGFVSHSVPNDPATIPAKLFAAYTPGSPLLFAPAAKLFGCGTYTDTGYNLLLLTLIACCVVWYLPAEPKHHLRRNLAALLAGVTIPGGLFFTDLDRPEPLALLLFFPLFMAWTRATSVRAQGLLAGCSGVLFLIHPYVGVVAYLLFFLFLSRAYAGSERWKALLLASTTALAWIAAWALAMHIADPASLHRFVEHAAGPKSGAGVVLHSVQGQHPASGPLQQYEAGAIRFLHRARTLAAFAVGALLVATPMPALLIEFVVAAVAVARCQMPNARRSSAKVLLALFCILFLFPAIVFPLQPSYFAASGALLFAVFARRESGPGGPLQGSKAPLILLLVAALFSAPALVLRVLNAAETRASYEHAVAQAARVKAEFLAQGKAHPRLLVDSAHYFIYKPQFADLYNIGYFGPNASLAAFDGLVKCYTGQLAFTREQMPWPRPINRDNWRLMDGDTESARITLLGHRIQHRNWSWSCDVYARR